MLTGARFGTFRHDIELATQMVGWSEYVATGMIERRALILTITILWVLFRRILPRGEIGYDLELAYTDLRRVPYNHKTPTSVQQREPKSFHGNYLKLYHNLRGTLVKRCFSLSSATRCLLRF